MGSKSHMLSSNGQLLQILIVCAWICVDRVSSQICVLPGTCSTGVTPTSGTNQIDIRIVTGTGIPTVAPGTCPPGLVLCTGSVVVQCGVRYVTPVIADDGNATAGAHPWAAYILNQTTYTGSGVLLDQFHILTAAHKVASNVATPFNIRVYMGVWDPINLAAAQNRTATRIVLHPNYNPTTLFNDIAIIRVDTPVALGVQATVNTACLPAQGASYVGQNCIVAGWGQSQFTILDAPSRPQRQVTVPIVPYTTCRTSFSASTVLSTNVDTFLDPTGEICAGGVQSRDACTSDGGAPLMCVDSTTGRYTAVGLVLWGKGCGQAGIYGVYNNVPNYRTFIDSTIATFNAAAG